MSKLVPKYTIWEAMKAALDTATKALQEVRDLARIPGPPGRDGFGFDDLDLVETDEGMMLRFVKGDEVKEFRLPVVLDRGVWKEGRRYRKGDGVSYGGSFWIAREETAEKPENGAKGWRLAVKRGRDGKDGILKAEKPKEPVRIA